MIKRMESSNSTKSQEAQQQLICHDAVTMIDIVQKSNFSSTIRARLEQDFDVSSLKLDASYLLIPAVYQKDDFSPMTNYILALQKELLSTPTPTSVSETSQLHPHISILPDPKTSDVMHNQISTSAALSNAPHQNLSLHDVGSNWAALLDSLKPALPAATTGNSYNFIPDSEKQKFRSEGSKSILREASCKVVDIKDNNMDLSDKAPDALRQPDVPTSSPLRCAVNDCCQTSSELEVHEENKRKTPHVNLYDLQNLPYVEKAHQKLKLTGSRKPGKNENRLPRYAIKTKSQMEIIDDGYRWRKYGRKIVKQNPHRRNYYKCSYPACKVKKRVERSPEDSSIIITTYEGTHTHQNPSISKNITQIDHNKSLLSGNVASSLGSLSSRDSYDLFVQMGEV